MFKAKIIRMVAAVFAVAFMVTVVAGCKNAADGSDDSDGSDDRHYSGIVGTWELNKNGSTYTFTFNADESFYSTASIASGFSADYSYYKLWRSKQLRDGYYIYFGINEKTWGTHQRKYTIGGDYQYVDGYYWTFHDDSVYYEDTKLTKK